MAEEGRDDIVEQTTNCLAEGFIVSLSGEMASACLRYPSLGPHKRGVAKRALKRRRRETTQAEWRHGGWKKRS